LLAGRESNELLVRGMAGAGKSTLLAHLAWWWQRTGLVGRVFRFSYEDRAWTAHQIVRDIRAKLFTPAEHAAADSLSEPAQIEQVAQRLRAQRHLLILDNAESITAAPASIPHALSAKEQAKLKTLLSRLHGGRTLVLLGSRESEDWLTTGSSGPGIYPLPGLDPQASSVLVDRILARNGGVRHLENLAEREALQDLVKLLGGYPLPLTVVLPVLATSKPSEVLAELRKGGPGADPTGLIHRAIEYSHGKLDESLQNSLLLLAPFTSVIVTGSSLEHYQELLLQNEAVQALGEIDLAAALDRAIAVGLAAPHPQIGFLVQVQPVLPYFLRSRLHDQPPLRAATDQVHYLLHRGLADELCDFLISGDAPQRRLIGQAGTHAEYGNLTTAVDFGLRTSQPIANLIVPLYHYLAQIQQYDNICRLLERTIADYPEPATQYQQLELSHLHEFFATAAHHLRQFDLAEGHEKAAIRLLERAGNRQRQAAIYHQIGRIASEQRRYAEAEASYRQALDIFLEFDDRHNAAHAYHQLGTVALMQGKHTEVLANYRQALDLFLEFNDRHNAANTYNNLGKLAQEQRRYAEAETNHRQALDIFLEFNDRHSAASVYHNLGVMAQEQQRYAEAQANYRQALDLFLEFNDQHSAASTYFQLASLAQEQRRYIEAEANYRKALDIDLESGDEHNASITATQLGIVLAHLSRHEEASRVLAGTAVSQYQRAGLWPKQPLQWLHRERPVVGADAFVAMLRDKVPGEVFDQLIAAIEAAGDPEEEPEAATMAGPRDNQ
jgi:tetratricopeptide (TPR) repeat protein